MPKVTLKASGPRLIRVHLDGKRVRFGNDGTATCKVSAGEHAITWFIRGTPGEKYCVELVSPKGARFQHSDRLDATMQDAGLKWITVED